MHNMRHVRLYFVLVSMMWLYVGDVPPLYKSLCFLGGGMERIALCEAEQLAYHFVHAAGMLLVKRFLLFFTS